MRRLRAVLIHELSHVKRWDALTQLWMRITCALHWYNPLVWLAAWRVRVERERACDDVVLRGGTQPSVYAEHLLALASGREQPRLAEVSAVAIAGRSSLERRLRLILDGRRNRRAVTRGGLALSFLAMAAVALPVAMIHAGSADPLGSRNPGAEPANGRNARDDAERAGDRVSPSIVVRVVDNSGAGVEGAVIGASTTATPGEKLTQHDYTTDGDGKATIELSSQQLYYLGLTAAKNGYTPLRMDWRNRGETNRIPGDYTFRLEKGTSIGGTVQDEAGEPIAGVKVFLTFNSSKHQGRPERLNFREYFKRTDQRGKWRCDDAPDGFERVSFRLEHPDYLSDTHFGMTPPPRLERLRKLTGVMVMRKGLALKGVVTAPDGSAVADAVVGRGGSRFGSEFPMTRTDGQGRFQFKHSPPGETVVTIVAARLGTGAAACVCGA